MTIQRRESRRRLWAYILWYCAAIGFAASFMIAHSAFTLSRWDIYMLDIGIFFLGYLCCFLADHIHKEDERLLIKKMKGYLRTKSLKEGINRR